MGRKKKAESTSSDAPRKKTDVLATHATATVPLAQEELSGSRQVGARWDFAVVGIGASAGGLDAFRKFFKAMPADSGMAFVLVPHLDPKHESLMVELLAKHTAMPVCEAKEGQPIKVNHVQIIPPNKFLTVREGRLRLTVPPESYGWQTVLDSFFRSLAEEGKEQAVGIVLSGTGNHGALGLKEIKLAGGMVMAQKPESADFDQMPRSAIATGLVDFVLTPEEMPAALIKYVKQPYLHGDSAAAGGDETSQEVLKRILVLLRSRTRYDFRFYRKNMVMRRIQRRMGFWQIEKLSAYLDVLRENPAEMIALHKDLLISVTSFFRDPEAFRVIEKRVIPELLEGKDGTGAIRVWVPGCATGEEAYSIAMLFMEQLAEAKTTPNLQIFATDIDEDVLGIARRGVYPESIVGDLSTPRLARFFTKSDDHSYQVNKRLREAVVFAPQNLIGDAPFSKLDLISCRNLLIYLEADIQTRVISLLHFALNDGGFLLLGPAETVGRQVDFFEQVSSRWRVYRRTGPTRRHLVAIPIDAAADPRMLPASSPEALPRLASGPVELMQKRLLADYAPASVLINHKFEVLCFQGPTVNYLEFPSGEPTQDVLALARQGLRTRLRTLVNEATRTGAAVTDTGSRVKRNANYVPCKITVKPFLEFKEASDLLLVVFEEGPQEQASLSPSADREGKEDSSLLRQLENELKATREDLQGTIEELGSSNEEMKAANEEMMSMNEELQSVNEELETSKEELQSTNEELTTVNGQLNQKVVELNAANNDIVNLLNSTDIPTIFLTTELRIRRFTPAALKLFHLQATDVGRPIEDVARRFTNDRLLDDCRGLLEQLTPIVREVQAENGQSYLRRILPYMTADRSVEGLVIAFIDITERKRAADAVNEAREYAESIVATVREPLLVLDDALRVRSTNPSFRRLFTVRPQEVENRPLFELRNRQWDSPQLRHMLEEVLPQDAEINDVEMTHTFDNIGERTMLLNARAIPSLEGPPRLILLAIEDITERKQAEHALRESEERLRAIVTTAADAILTIDEQGNIESCNTAAQQMFQYPASEMIGQQIEMIIPSGYFGEPDEFLARYLRGDHLHRNGIRRGAIGRCKGGATFPIDLSVSELHAGSHRLFTGIIRDVSDRKSLQQELLSITEQERRRIGQNLHDDVGQELTGLALKAETLSEVVAARQIPESALAAELVAGLDRIRSKVRALASMMVPVEVDSNGLVCALEELTARLCDVHGLSCIFECQNRSIDIDAHKATQLYHIAQEAITNAIKHGHARTIRVKLVPHQSTIKLEIWDDGIGISEQTTQPQGMGLRIMSYRAELIGGKLDVTPGGSGGTLVTCLVMKGLENG